MSPQRPARSGFNGQTRPIDDIRNRRSPDDIPLGKTLEWLGGKLEVKTAPGALIGTDEGLLLEVEFPLVQASPLRIVTDDLTVGVNPETGLVARPDPVREDPVGSDVRHANRDFTFPNDGVTSVIGDSTIGSFTVTLPDATKVREVSVKRDPLDISANVITIDTLKGQLVERVEEVELTLSHEILSFKSDGTDWYVLG